MPESERRHELVSPGSERKLADAREGPVTDRRSLSQMSIREIEDLVAGAPPEPGDSLWRELKSDRRKGVALICHRLAREKARADAGLRRLEDMRRAEREIWAAGLEFVAGVDEAGRGPLAGPVMAAAVILPRDLRIVGIDDSKKLAPRKREELFELIRRDAVAIGVGSASEKTIDEINILNATRQAMRDAVKDLGRVPDHVLVDGDAIPGLGIPQTGINRGDESSAAIAAASIVAKVTRDRILVEFDARYPGYGFARHKGYGTSEHLAALTRLGPCEIHRRSFRVVHEAGGGFSERYAAFRSGLLAADTPERLERVARDIARVKRELVPYELSRLRGLYKRCYVRLKAGLTKVK